MSPSTWKELETMVLPQLPVPKLEPMLESLRASAAARFSDAPEARQAIRAAIDAFGKGTGPALQERLEEFAAAENAEGRSWLQNEWLRGYFASRTPLPLTSNVAFALTLPAEEGDDVTRLATTLHRIVSVHLGEVRGETPPQVDGRGAALDMTQFRVLAGGLRDPRRGTDTFRRPTPALAHREVGVFVGSRLFAMTVSDEHGLPLSVPALTAGLRSVLEGLESPRNAQLPGGFASPSYLGSEILAPLLDDLLRTTENARTYARLADMICTVTLTDDGVADAEIADGGDDPTLRLTLTDPGRAWTYKPLSYQLDVHACHATVHVEHSMFDGGVLAEAVRRMQDVVPDRGTAAGPPSAPEELTWRTDAETRDRIADALTTYTEKASRLRVARLRLPRVPDTALPFRMSLDALHQVTLTVAQVLAYSRVRGVYESVDMRTYVGGRTECLRPVTEAAVEFARALAAGTASREQFTAMLDAHRTWVKACKVGDGFDRHLLGLELMADRGRTDEPFFGSEELRQVRTDFLSTTSLGAPTQVVDYAFAPTSEDGFGVCYTPYPDALGYVVTYTESASDDPQGFLTALRRAAGLLRDFLGGLEPENAV